MSGYQRLEVAPVRSTVDRLTQRIQARFPERNLSKVALELRETVDELLVQPESRWYRTILISSRVLISILVTLVIAALVMILVRLQREAETPTVWDWASIVESMINDMVFAGVGIWFLWQVPNRIQRAHQLKALHKLRSLAHIIDMHQLTKDPDRLSRGFKSTSQTVQMNLDVHQLWSYLDYCSEMLALVGKTAALYAEDNNDQVVLQNVQSIEDLTINLSQKIWQKISSIRPDGTVGPELPPETD